MNLTSRKGLFSSLILLVGATFFMGACGPEGLEDPALSSDDSINAALEADAPKADMEENEMNEMAAKPMRMPPKMNEEMEPPPAVLARPVVELPGGYVKLPTEVVNEPLIVTNSEEDLNYQRRVLFEKDILVNKPAQHNHLRRHNTLTVNEFKTNIINRPSIRNTVSDMSTAAVTSAVLPTTEITLPVANFGTSYGFNFGLAGGLPYMYGYGGYYGNADWGQAPGCAPYRTRGLWRYCR